MLSDVEPMRRRLGLCEESTGIDPVKQETGRATPSDAMLKTRLLQRPLGLLPNFPSCAKSTIVTFSQRGRNNLKELSTIREHPVSQALPRTTLRKTDSDSRDCEPGENEVTVKPDSNGEKMGSRCLPSRSRTPTQQNHQQRPLNRSYLSRYKTSVPNIRPSTAVEFSSSSSLSIRDPFHRPPSPLIKFRRTPLIKKVIPNNTDVQRGDVNGQTTGDCSLLHETDKLHHENGMGTAIPQLNLPPDVSNHKDYFGNEVVDSIQRSTIPRLQYPSETVRPHSMADKTCPSSEQTTINLKNQVKTDQLGDHRASRTISRRFVIARNGDVRGTTGLSTPRQPTNLEAKQSNSYEAYRVRFRASQQATQHRKGEVCEGKIHALHQLRKPENHQTGEHGGQQSKNPDVQQPTDHESRSTNRAAQGMRSQEDYNEVANPNALICPDVSNKFFSLKTPNDRSRIIAGMIRPSTPIRLTPSQMKLRRNFQASESTGIRREVRHSTKDVIRIPYVHTTSVCSDRTEQECLRQPNNASCRGSDTHGSSPEIHSPVHNRGDLEFPENGTFNTDRCPLPMRRECPTPPMNMASESSLSSIDVEIISQEFPLKQNRTDTDSNEKNNNELPIDVDDRILSWLWDCEQTTECTSLTSHLPNIGVS